MIGSGRRRHLVSLQRNTASRTTSGAVGPVQWMEYAQEWVSIDGLTGGENLQANALREKSVFRVKMLYRSDVLGGDRIVEGSAVYDIKSIHPSNSNDELTLTAETGRNG